MTRRRLEQAEPDCRTSTDSFWKVLSETVGWCAPRADEQNPATCLRDSYLRPRALESDYFHGVSAVAAWRRHKDFAPAEGRSLAGGRLLLYFPDADLCDGAAEAESRGFFDVHNCPPWDTWVGMFRDAGTGTDNSTAHYLVAWVPPKLLTLAHAGVSVNPEECIGWIDEVKPGLWSVLSSGGGHNCLIWR